MNKKNAHSENTNSRRHVSSKIPTKPFLSLLEILIGDNCRSESTEILLFLIVNLHPQQQ